MNSTRSNRLAQLIDAVYIQFAEFDIGSANLRGEAGLRQVCGAHIDPHDPGGTPPLHLERVEPRIAADVEHGFSGEIRRYGTGEVQPLTGWIVAEKVIGSCRHAAEVDVLEPVAELPALCVECPARTTGKAGSASGTAP